MIGLGRLRGPGMGQEQRMLSYWAVELQPNTMDPISWLSSDPARKLSLRYDSSTSRVGEHIFMTPTPVTSVDMFLRRDPRVRYASLIRQAPLEEAVVVTPGSGTPIAETRPAPGKPQMVLPGYIPKNPGSNGGKLSWDEKQASMAGMGDLESDAKGIVATAEAKTGVPWWGLALGALLLLRR